MIDQGPKCPRCKNIVFNLIKEHLPRMVLRMYPDGLCRNCKRIKIKELRRLLK